MKQKNSIKFNILKRMLGKRVAVITDYAKFEHFYGEVSEVLNEELLLIKSDKGEDLKISIFDVRNPSQEL